MFQFKQLEGRSLKNIRGSTGFEPVTSSNPVEALIFFRLLPSNCLNWKIYCDDHSSLSFYYIDTGKYMEITSSINSCEIMEIKPLGPECSFYEFIFSSKTLVYI